MPSGQQNLGSRKSGKSRAGTYSPLTRVPMTSNLALLVEIDRLPVYRSVQKTRRSDSVQMQSEFGEKRMF